jgi:spore coat protein CotH
MLKTPGVAVAVAVVALLAGPALAQAPADPAASLFAPGRILRIEIEMAPADWREVRISHRDGSDPQMANIAKDGAYAYRPATITIDGVKVARVGIRKKGLLGSVVSTRPSLKVEFDEFVEGQTFQGLDGLT